MRAHTVPQVGQKGSLSLGPVVNDVSMVSSGENGIFADVCVKGSLCRALPLRHIFAVFHQREYCTRVLRILKPWAPEWFGLR